MDVKYLRLLIIFSLTLITLHSAKSDVSIAKTDTNKQCITKFKGCTLTLDSLQLKAKGDKGVAGFPGLTGRTGPKGDKGDNGRLGPPGMKGEKGRDGLKGDYGFYGLSGLPGIKGDKGVDGPVGPPGLPGLPGNCGCTTIAEVEESDGSDGASDGTFATEEHPAGKACKYASASVESGIKYMGPTLLAFQVYCNMTSKETCIRGGVNSKKINLKNVQKNKPFWLSEQGVDLKTVYNLTTDQLMWLQKQSSSVKQILRYHCRDFVPYSETDASLSVQLLTWNDIVIGPNPTDKTPFSYTVPSGKNMCTAGSDTYQSSDIVLESNYVNRLPIIDMQIRDVRNDRQEFYLESVEICFA